MEDKPLKYLESNTIQKYGLIFIQIIENIKFMTNNEILLQYGKNKKKMGIVELYLQLNIGKSNVVFNRACFVFSSS